MSLNTITRRATLTGPCRYISHWYTSLHYMRSYTKYGSVRRKHYYGHSFYGPSGTLRYKHTPDTPCFTHPSFNRKHHLIIPNHMFALSYNGIILKTTVVLVLQWVYTDYGVIVVTRQHYQYGYF